MANLVSKETLQELANLIANDLKNKEDVNHTHDMLDIDGLTEAIGNINSFDVVVTDTLPDTTLALAHTIYMVPKTASQTNNVYDEYMLLNGAFEKIGDTQIDLSQYATKTELNSKADVEHTHDISEVNDLQTTIDSKLSRSEFTIDNIEEPYGTNITSGLSQIDRRSLDFARGCKTAFIPANHIKIEHTNDGGQKWVEDTEIPDEDKMRLFSCNRDMRLKIGKTDNRAIGNASRVTITAINDDGSSERYCLVDRFYAWFGANGDGITVKIEASTIGTQDVFETLFDNEEVKFSGWENSGYIKLDGATFGGYSGQVENYGTFRFTFKTALAEGQTEIQYPTSFQQVCDIRMYGESVWIAPNNFMSNDHLYYWDYEGNAYFMSNVEGVRLRENGEYIDNKYATKTELSTGLEGKADETHTHLVSDITDMETVTTSDVETVWNSIESADVSIPSHTHSISDVTDLTTSLNEKVSSTQVTNIVTLTQTEYDELSTKDSSTLYIIT